MCPPHLYLNRHGNVISRVVPASSDLTQPKAALRGDITYHPNYLTTAKMAKTHKRNFGLSNTVHHILCNRALKCPVKPFFLLVLYNVFRFSVPVTQTMKRNAGNVKVIDLIFRELNTHTNKMYTLNVLWVTLVKSICQMYRRFQSNDITNRYV